MIKQIKKEARYYWKDFWKATFGSIFSYSYKFNNTSQLPDDVVRMKELFEKTSKSEKRENNLSSRQIVLNNAFYATIWQVILAIIIGVPSSLQIKSIFYLFFAIDAIFYIFLGFMVSKQRKWAGGVLFIWFCLDKLLIGIIRLITHFSLISLIYFIVINYLFGYYYYKAFKYLRKK